MRSRYFLAGLATAYLAGAGAFIAGLWTVNSGMGRHPLQVCQKWWERRQLRR